jgi:hypothetical protein
VRPNMDPLANASPVYSQPIVPTYRAALSADGLRHELVTSVCPPAGLGPQCDIFRPTITANGVTYYYLAGADSTTMVVADKVGCPVTGTDTSSV